MLAQFIFNPVAHFLAIILLVLMMAFQFLLVVPIMILLYLIAKILPIRESSKIPFKEIQDYYRREIREMLRIYKRHKRL